MSDRPAFEREQLISLIIDVGMMRRDVATDVADAIISKWKAVARLVEDRARFPDRPDDVGRMINAHIENLKANKEAADRHAVRAMEQRERSSRKWCEAAEIAIQKGDFRPLQLRVDACKAPFEATETN